MNNFKHFFIDKYESLADSIINIELRNLPPNTEVDVITTTSTPFYCINAPLNTSKNTKWRSKNTFITNEHGELNLNESSPIKGEYKGAFPMGIISFMKPADKLYSTLELNINNIGYNESSAYEICLYIEDLLIDRCEIKRYFKHPNIISKQVRLENSICRYFYTINDKKLPAIIVLSGSEGGIEKAQCIAELLSSHGFATIAVSYFGLDGITKNLSKIPLETIKEVIDFLTVQKGIDSNRIGIYGRSKGAEFAMLAASYFSEIKCVVANSPTNMVFEGIKGKLPSKSSSWTYKNIELNYFPFKFSNLIYSKIFKKTYPDHNQYYNCQIPVEKINGNILCISATNDEIWDSYASCLQIKRRLSEKNFKNSIKIEFYSNSGHMMTVPFIPNNRYNHLNNVSQMSETVTSWNNIIKFFIDNLINN